MDSIIPYGKQLIDEDDIEAVVKVLRSDFLTTGPLCREFEEKLAQKVGAKHAVVFSSGTAALHAAYFAAGLEPGQQVITTPITFAATANAALYLGGVPVFADIAPDSFNIDVTKIESAITAKTKIIAPVDMAGIPVDIDPIMQLAEKYNLVVVEDACHALGATYKGRPVGSTAHMSVFSFHPVKAITTGEGGAVVTSNPDYYERLVLFRSHGIVKSPDKLMHKHKGPWYQEMQLLGYNYRMTDIQCALGMSQLKKLDAFVHRRREIAAQYTLAFQDNNAIEIPAYSADVNPAWHLYIIRLKEDLDRDRVCYYLRERGIGTQVHYIPVYRHPYYSYLGYNPEEYPNAEAYYRSCLSIPIFPALTNSEIEKVINVINRIN